MDRNHFGFAIRITYALGLAVGTFTHALTLLRHGWSWDYGGMPIGTVVF